MSFSRHPHPIIWVICLGGLAMVFAVPFGRRNDWLGWLAFLVMATVVIALWTIFIVGITRRIVEWCRDKPAPPDHSGVGECFTEHIYSLAWDHEHFSLRTHSGACLSQVPISNLLEILDLDALLVEGDVTVRTPDRVVEFPPSRSGSFAIMQLIRDLVQSNEHVREEIRKRRNRMLRQGIQWLPASLLLGAALIWGAVTFFPNRPHFLGFVVLGLPFAGAVHWLFWRFGLAITWLSAARTLHSMLSGPARFGPGTTDPFASDVKR